jgi:hypothetical protein
MVEFVMDRAAEYPKAAAGERTPDIVVALMVAAMLERVLRRRGDSPEPAAPSPDLNRPPPPAACELVFS